MTPIVIVAGTIAALILFRWARTLLIFGIAGLVLWFFVHHAHAQPSMMVQCRTGATAIVVPDYVCDAFLDGFRHVTREASSIPECSKAIALHFENGNPLGYFGPCQRMWAGELQPRVDLLRRP